MEISCKERVSLLYGGAELSVSEFDSQLADFYYPNQSGIPIQ